MKEENAINDLLSKINKDIKEFHENYEKLSNMNIKEFHRHVLKHLSTTIDHLDTLIENCTKNFFMGQLVMWTIIKESFNNPEDIDTIIKILCMYFLSKTEKSTDSRQVLLRETIKDAGEALYTTEKGKANA